MEYFVCYAIGLIIGVFVTYVIMHFIYTRNIESDPDAIGIGTLYVYEGVDRDRYSFAFDCPLDQVGKFKKVTLEVKKRNEKSLRDIESDLLAKDFDPNMD